MAALFQAAGSAVNTTTTTLALVAPTVVAGDLMFAWITTHDNTAISGQDARWISIYSANNTAAQRNTLFYMFVNNADSAATFNFTIAGTTAGLGRLYTWRGATGIGASSNSANASSATVTWATMTPQFANSVIASFMAVAVQTGSDGGMTGGTAQTFTARGGSQYNIGSTDASEAYSCESGGVQAPGAMTMNNTSAAVNVGVFVEVLSQTVASGGGSNTGGFAGGQVNRNMGMVNDLTRGAPRGLASGLTGG